jgi:hypothetical protein
VTDIVAELREDAKTADGGEYPEDGCRWAITMRAAADEIERLRTEVMVLRHYGNKGCTGMADEALELKRTTGKFPFED